MTRAYLAALALALSVPYATPQAPAAAAARIAIVDFTAIGADGSAIEDLRPADIAVRIGSTHRPVRALRLVTTGARSAEDVPPAFGSSLIDDTRHRTLLVVFDNESMRPGRERPFREALSQVIGRLAPEDRVAVVTLPLGGMRLDFTTDHARARHVISRLGGDAPRRHDARDFACRSRRVLETLTDLLDTISGGSPTSVVFISSSLSGLTRDAATDALAGGMCEIVSEQFEAVGTAAARARANFHIMQIEDQMIAPGRVTPGDLAGTSITDLSVGLEHLAGVTGAELLRLGGSSGASAGRILRDATTYYVATVDAHRDDGDIARLEVTTTRAAAAIRARPRIALALPDPADGGKSVITPRDMLRQARAYGGFELRAAAFASSHPGDGRVRVIAVAETARDVGLTGTAMGLFDQSGRLVAQWTAEPGELAARPLIAAMPVAPGRYRLRVAATDVNGRAATADYTFDAVLARAGSAKISGLVLGLSRGGAFTPRLLFGTEPTALAQVDLHGVDAATTGRFEVARRSDGPALATGQAVITAAAEPGRATMTGVIAIGALPPGDYVVRAIVTTAGGSAKTARTLSKRQYY